MNEFASTLPEAVEKRELSDAQDRFLASSMAEARKLKESANDPSEIKEYIKKCTENYSLEEMISLRELDDGDLREYTKIHLGTEEKELLPQYLDFLKKTVTVAKRRANYQAMNAYVHAHAQFSFNPGDLISEKTGQSLHGAVLTARKAAILRQKEFDGREKTPLFAEIIIQRIEEEMKALDAAIQARIDEAVPEKKGIAQRLGVEFSRLVERFPRLRITRRRVVASMLVLLAAWGLKTVYQEQIASPSVEAFVDQAHALELTGEDLQDLRGGIRAELPSGPVPSGESAKEPGGQTGFDGLSRVSGPSESSTVRDQAAKVSGMPDLEPATAQDLEKAKKEVKTTEVKTTIVESDRSIVQKMAQKALEETGYKRLLYPVSSQTRLPEDFPYEGSEAPLEKVDGGSREIQVAQACAQPLRDLMAAAREAGFNPDAFSGFRTIKYQEGVFAREVARFEAQGLPHEKAVQKAMTLSARPGYSEHHTGFAVDIRDGDYQGVDFWDDARRRWNQGFYKWLRKNAHKYGWVISYPTGPDINTAKGGSGYPSAEPWHVRCMGKEIAQYLFGQDYLDPSLPLTLNSFLKGL